MPTPLPASVVDELRRQLSAEHLHLARVSQTLQELAADGMAPERLGNYRERLDALGRDAELLSTRRARLRTKLARPLRTHSRGGPAC